MESLEEDNNIEEAPCGYWALQLFGAPASSSRVLVEDGTVAGIVVVSAVAVVVVAISCMWQLFLLPQLVTSRCHHAGPPALP